MTAPAANLQRSTFRTSRLLEFCSRKELIAQTGHEPEAWPLVLLKELLDNALDACEEAGIAPEIIVQVEPDAITVVDNGPGLPPDTVAALIDLSVRVSSREAYVAPDRGAQGNALKTILAMPFVLDGRLGRVSISARGIRHEVEFSLDAIRQQPVIRHDCAPCDVKTGTSLTVVWPDSAGLLLEGARARFLQFADDFSWLNPHLALTVDWMGERHTVPASEPQWRKWRPCDPTCPHWYSIEDFERLIAAYLTHDVGGGRGRTVRELVAKFRGFSGSLKQKAVLDATGLHRKPIAELGRDQAIDRRLAARLLEAMTSRTRPVRPQALGVLGSDHLRRRFKAAGCEDDTFQYKLVQGTREGLPWLVEAAFAWCPNLTTRRLITGINWSPGIVNPFRSIGPCQLSLDTVLSQQRADRTEPVILLLHLAYPRIRYTDRGKSAVVMEG